MQNLVQHIKNNVTMIKKLDNVEIMLSNKLFGNNIISIYELNDNIIVWHRYYNKIVKIKLNVPYNNAMALEDNYIVISLNNLSMIVIKFMSKYTQISMLSTAGNEIETKIFGNLLMNIKSNISIKLERVMSLFVGEAL